MKNGDTVGGIEQLLRAIDEADVTSRDQLFSGVISQIPMNLYLRGEREAAFKAAQNRGSEVWKRSETTARRWPAFTWESSEQPTPCALPRTAIKLAPDLAEAHRLLAVGLHISLRLDDAIAEYKKTVELDPTSKASRGSLADLYRASGKAEEALALYNEQLAADPKDRAARAGKVIRFSNSVVQTKPIALSKHALADEPRNLPLLAGAAYWLGSARQS